MKQTTIVIISFLFLKQLCFSQDTIPKLMNDVIRIQQNDKMILKNKDSTSLTKGIYKLLEDNKKITTIPIDENGDINGTIISIDSSGYKKQFTYKKGILDGFVRHWDNGVLLLEDKIENGKSIYSKIYFENGELRFIKLFENENPISTKEYYLNRNLKYVCIYKNGNIISQKEYFENGKIEREELVNGDNYIAKRYNKKGVLLSFDDTKKQIEQRFNENGTLEYEKKLVEPILKRVEEKFYSENGKLNMTIVHIDGVIQGVIQN